MELKEGEDYYIDDRGLLVFTARYLLQRGSCCGSGCLHCPYDYVNIAEPLRSKLLSLRKNEKEDN
jgi:hypothetical protein